MPDNINNEAKESGHIDAGEFNAVDPYLAQTVNQARADAGLSEATKTVIDELGGAEARRRVRLLNDPRH